YIGAGKNLVVRGGGELQDAVLHGEDGVMAGKLPLAVGADARKAVADLDGAENSARRAHHHRGIVLDWSIVRAAAELRAGDLCLLAGQMQKHIEAVRAEIA